MGLRLRLHLGCDPTFVGALQSGSVDSPPSLLIRFQQESQISNSHASNMYLFVETLKLGMNTFHAITNTPWQLQFEHGRHYELTKCWPYWLLRPMTRSHQERHNPIRSPTMFRFTAICSIPSRDQLLHNVNVFQRQFLPAPSRLLDYLLYLLFVANEINKYRVRNHWLFGPDKFKEADFAFPWAANTLTQLVRMNHDSEDSSFAKSVIRGYAWCWITHFRIHSLWKSWGMCPMGRA